MNERIEVGDRELNSSESSIVGIATNKLKGV